MGHNNTSHTRARREIGTMNDLERRLENWGRWKRDAGSLRSILGGSLVSTIYRLSPRGSRAGTAMVVMVGEALDMDRAIQRLDVTLQRVLEVRYVLRPRIDADLWRLASCSQATFFRRLEHACFVLRSMRCERVSENPLVT